MVGILLEVIIKGILELLAGRITQRAEGWMEQRCMINKCGRQRAKRGLCLVCYSKAKKKVESGETTWEQLEYLGLCAEESSPFDDAYSKAMREE